MTNGVVSVVKDGQVAMKLVVGCDGRFAPIVAESIEALGRVPTREEAAQIAQHEGFGCADCLVIQTADALDPHDSDIQGLVDRYRSTFSDPEANPRWQHKAEYTKVVSFGVDPIAADNAAWKHMLDHPEEGRINPVAHACYPGNLDLTEAFKIAVEVHGAQRDKSGEPYMFHVMRVAMQMESDEERVVAILHDAIEDAPPEEKVRLLVRIGVLYGGPVQQAVAQLTHTSNEPYLDYIRRLSSNPLAVKVKLADLLDNADPARLAKLGPEEAARLSKKYDEAYRLLVELTRPQTSTTAYLKMPRIPQELWDWANDPSYEVFNREEKPTHQTDASSPPAKS